MRVVQTARADGGAAGMHGGTVPSPWQSCLCGADRSATPAGSVKHRVGVWGGVCLMRLLLLLQAGCWKRKPIGMAMEAKKQPCIQQTLKFSIL